ncbi:ATP-binding cassette domain-containing protein [Natronospora cellulosivora (SeqCode)]
MLQLKNVNIKLKNKNKLLLDNFNFTLNNNDKVAIIGEEGNGKSTLLKLIYNTDLIEEYCYFSGQIIKEDICLGYLEQEINSKWNSVCIYDYLVKNNPLSNTYDLLYDYSQLVSIFTRLKLKPALIQSKQKIGTLSGGEKIKIQLAKILIRNPDILLLDEPTNDLDILTLKWLENFIISSKKSIIYISHDETLIENTANTIIHLERIKKKQEPRHNIENMGYKDYISKRSSILEKQEQVAKKQREEHTKSMKHWRQIYSKVAHQQETITRQDPGGGRLLKKKMKAVKSLEHRLMKEKKDFLDIPDVEEAINIKFNDVDLPDRKVILDLNMDYLKVEEKVLSHNLQLLVKGSDHVAIIGDNGVGKSTLLKVIYKYLINREDINVAYMPQNYKEKLNYNKKPLAFLAPNGHKDDITRAYTYMGSMKFTKREMNQNIKELSGGQKAKLLFLEMILNEYNVLLLDEPTRNFSTLSNSVIIDGLKEFNGVIISVSHDRKYIREVCNCTYKLTVEGLKQLKYDF